MTVEQMSHAAQVRTDSGLVITAEAIDPGHRYDARLSYETARGESHELAGWFVSAHSAPEALAALIEYESRTGGLKPAEAAELTGEMELLIEPATADAHLANRWAGFARGAVGPNVVDDAAWPSLAAALDRADADGWNVAANLPLLAAQGELPSQFPARELHFRLMADCAAAMPTTPAAGAVTADATAHGGNAREHAEVSLQQQMQPTIAGREALGR